MQPRKEENPEEWKDKEMRKKKFYEMKEKNVQHNI